MASIVACLAISFSFPACEPTDPDDDDGDNSSFNGKLSGQIVNADGYNLTAVKAFDYKEEWEIATGTCQNGNFTITLPATVESSRLNSFGLQSGIILSDANVKQTHINLGDGSNLYAYDNAGIRINYLTCWSEDGRMGIETIMYVDRDCAISGSYVSTSDRNDDGIPDEYTLTYNVNLKVGWNIIYAIVKENGAELTTTKPNADLKWYLGDVEVVTPDPEVPVKQISNVTESAVFNSDYYSSGYAYEPYAPHTIAFAYDNAGRIKEIYDNDVLALTWNYEIAGEVRIKEESNDYDETYRATLNNGKVNRIQWAVDATNNPDGYVADLTYNADGYLTGHTSTDTYGYSDCNTQRLVWNNGNVAAVQALNCTTQVYSNRATYEYDQALNNKTNLDLNVLFFDILANPVLDSSYDMIYQHPACYFALTGLTGKRSKNLLKRNTSELETASSGLGISIYTEATAPAVGDVLSTYYNRSFDGNLDYTFNTDGYPTQLNRQVKVAKTQIIYEDGEREYVEPQDDSEHQWWTDKYGAGPWFRIINMKINHNTTVKNDIYTWTIQYR
jgi:YD repeat-containing protein